jgi:hypothetical protein
VNGRRFQVRKYLDEGKPLECRDIERCQYCFIESFCTSADRVIARQNQATWDVWWIGTPEGAAATAGLSLDTLPFGARSVGVEIDDLTDLEHLPVPEDVGIYVKPQHDHAHGRARRRRQRAGRRGARRGASRRLLPTPRCRRGAGRDRAQPSTGPWLLAHRDRVQALLSRIHLRQPSYEFMKDAVVTTSATRRSSSNSWRCRSRSAACRRA